MPAASVSEGPRARLRHLAPHLHGRFFRPRAACVLVALPLALAACGESDGVVGITSSRVVASPRPVLLGASAAERLGLNPEPAPATGAGLFAWDVPEGWEELPATSQRVANFRVGGHPEAECYLSVLSGTGGGLAANINRWRQQLSLPEASSAELASLETIPMLSRQATLVQLQGTYAGGPDKEPRAETMLVGAIHGGEGAPFTIFAKLLGPAAVIAPQLPAFKQFCASLRVADRLHAGIEGGGAVSGTSAGGGPGSESGFDPSSLRWKAPASWVKRPERAMRSVTYAPAAESESECYVAVLGGAGGGREANINRWRQQMGAPPLSDTEIEALPTIDVLGSRATLVEVTGTYAGMGGEAKGQYMMLGVVCVLPSYSVFVKMIGPETEVKAERSNFIAFCQSLES
ncbi:MAG: hypothetical protein AB1486_06565 [Planctomycetota bacterium]